MPQVGEPLILVDGRRFTFGEIQDGVRGWWFVATANEGSSTLQGNLQLEWDAQADAWRPVGSGVPTTPPSLRTPSQPGVRQVD